MISTIKRSAIAAGFILLASSAARADVQQGLHIFSACRGVNVHFCQGYITAIADEMSGGLEFRKYRACIPKDVSQEPEKRLIEQRRLLPIGGMTGARNDHGFLLRYPGRQYP